MTIVYIDGDDASATSTGIPVHYHDWERWNWGWFRCYSCGVWTRY